MNKALAEILAGVIPEPMARNQWRGRLRYGPLNALALRAKMAREKSEPQHYLAICAIAKNEAPYFSEWIEWHRSRGVEKFYIYDNESTDNILQVLDPYIQTGLVEYAHFPGTAVQLAAYDDCLRRHRLDCRWLAIIDIDEFIVPVRDANIPEFLSRFEDFAAVEINWLCYGSGGQKEKRPGGVMERFKCHAELDHELNCHVKTILDPRRVCNMIGCHEAARVSGKTADSHGNVVTENFRRRQPQHDVIRINHYAVKSFEEFMQKRARGRARGKQRTRPMDYFDRFDLNDICEE